MSGDPGNSTPGDGKGSVIVRKTGFNLSIPADRLNRKSKSWTASRKAWEADVTVRRSVQPGAAPASVGVSALASEEVPPGAAGQESVARAPQAPAARVEEGEVERAHPEEAQTWDWEQWHRLDDVALEASGTGQDRRGDEWRSRSHSPLAKRSRWERRDSASRSPSPRRPRRGGERDRDWRRGRRDRDVERRDRGDDRRDRNDDRRDRGDDRRDRNDDRRDRGDDRRDRGDDRRDRGDDRRERKRDEDMRDRDVERRSRRRLASSTEAGERSASRGGREERPVPSGGRRDRDRDRGRASREQDDRAVQARAASPPPSRAAKARAASPPPARAIQTRAAPSSPALAADARVASTPPARAPSPPLAGSPARGQSPPTRSPASLAQRRLESLVSRWASALVGASWESLPRSAAGSLVEALRLSSQAADCAATSAAWEAEEAAMERAQALGRAPSGSAIPRTRPFTAPQFCWHARAEDLVSSDAEAVAVPWEAAAGERAAAPGRAAAHKDSKHPSPTPDPRLAHRNTEYAAARAWFRRQALPPWAAAGAAPSPASWSSSPLLPGADDRGGRDAAQDRSSSARDEELAPPGAPAHDAGEGAGAALGPEEGYWQLLDPVRGALGPPAQLDILRLEGRVVAGGEQWGWPIFRKSDGLWLELRDEPFADGAARGWGGLGQGGIDEETATSPIASPRGPSALAWLQHRGQAALSSPRARDALRHASVAAPPLAHPPRLSRPAPSPVARHRGARDWLIDASRGARSLVARAAEPAPRRWACGAGVAVPSAVRARLAQEHSGVKGVARELLAKALVQALKGPGREV